MQGDFADAQSREGESNSPRSTHFSPLRGAFLLCLDFCPNPLRRFLARIPLRRKFSKCSSKHFVQALLHVGFASAVRQPCGNSVGFRLVLVLRCAGKKLHHIPIEEAAVNDSEVPVIHFYPSFLLSYTIFRSLSMHAPPSCTVVPIA